MPRTSMLNEIKRHEICALLACGASRRDAAEYVDCATTTIANTAARDPDFAECLRQAECHYALRNLRAINRAATRSWRAGVWALRQHDPESFGRNRVSHVPPASIARAAARETAVGVPASAGPSVPHAGPAQSSHPDTAAQSGPSLRDGNLPGPPVRPAPIVGQQPPLVAAVVGHASPFDSSPPFFVGHKPPSNAPINHALRSPSPPVACRRASQAAGGNTALYWAAALVACFLLGFIQPVPSLRDGAPSDNGTSDSPAQPHSTAVQQPIVGHQPPSDATVQLPIVGHQPPPNAAVQYGDPRAAATEISLFTAIHPVNLRLPWWKRLTDPAP